MGGNATGNISLRAVSPPRIFQIKQPDTVPSDLGCPVRVHSQQRPSTYRFVPTGDMTIASISEEAAN